MAQTMLIETLITVSFPERLLNRLQGISPKLNISSIPAARPEEIPAEIWARTEILYTTSALPTPEMVPALRWVQFHFAGIDRYLSQPLLEKDDLLITTLSGAAMSQMAEYALTMMLALGRKIPALGSSQKKSEWPKDKYERFTPFELRGKTVGIVGYGSIGRQIARLLQPFGVTVLAAKYNAKQTQDYGYMLEGLGDPQGDFVHRIYPFQALESMLKECHFAVVTVPLTPQTRGLLNTKTLNALKPGAYLVDISRGGVIDQPALLEALKSGKLAGAALDVFPEEPLPPNNPLWQMPNVIITPHISGSSPHYEERAIDLFSENLHRYLGELPLYNLFDPERGY
jgi:phosphoglycerate dehydrogenase-like enzyme